ncbi:unnamed protein product [Sphagnum troendelagicum]
MWFQYPQLQTAPQTHTFGSQLRASRYLNFTAFSALQGLFNLTSCRPHLLAILQLGYAVLYNDVDLVWLADPFPLFEGHHDIFLSDDLAVVKPEIRSHEQPPPGKKGCTHLCSCMLFLRLKVPDYCYICGSRSFRVSHGLSMTEKTTNQGLLELSTKQQARYLLFSVDVYLLPQVAFSPGGLYFTIDS